MSIATEISRLTSLRNSIRTKLIALGILSNAQADLQDIYDGISGISAKSSSNLTVSGNTVTAPAGYYNSAASKSVGTAKAGATYYVSSSDQKIESGYYLTGDQTIKAVTTSNISAANIKDGIVVKVGDSANAGRITSVTGTFTDASTVSSGQTAAAAGNILSGYSAWVDGAEVKGTIATKTSANMTVSGKTVTAPAGYYASNQSKSVADGSISASATGSATVSSLTFTYDSANSRFNISGSGSITGTATATVGTAGYVSSNATGSTTGTATVSANIAKIAGSTSITGDSTKKPTISRTTTTASGATNVGSGNASTTAPSSGYFVSVKSSANTGTLTATPTVSTAGYGTSSNHGITAATKTVGASASDETYITVPGGSAQTPATTITKNPTISVDSSGKITASVSGTQSVTPTVSAGYITSGTAGTITVAGSASSQLPTKAAATYTPGTTDQTISSGQYLTGVQTIKGDANLIAANIKKGVTIFGITGTYTGIVDSNDTDDPLQMTLIGTVGS